MTGHHFICYSPADTAGFAPQLYDALWAESIPAWLDQRDLHAGLEWDEQLLEAIRTCRSLLFIMTRDSVEAQSVCKQEWGRALAYKKPIVPLRLHPDAEMPFRLGVRQYIDFSGEFKTGLARLRQHLAWLDSPEGQLQALKDRLADAQRDLRRTREPHQQARIQADIDILKQQIAAQQQVVDHPEDIARRVEASIQAGLERERQPEKPASGRSRSKFINPPPALVPTYFQDRYLETKLIGDFLGNEVQRLLTVVGRGGIGKTALVCRLLKALESGRLPDDLGDLPVAGIVYLSATGSRRVNLPNLYADLSQLLPATTATELETLYKNPHASAEAKMRALLAVFPALAGRVLLLLDNFEDVLDPDSRNIADVELAEALRASLELPPHGVKIIITTRLAARDLALVHPERQFTLSLDEGLDSPFAENILREMDADGKLGLADAPAELLAQAKERTRGYPRALEALFAILSADRHTRLEEILAADLPDNVIEALVGEAFNRLDPTTQQVMQALAIYGRPVTPTAVDYLLQSYTRGLDSAPILNRLVNMQFVRKEAGRYYLHPVDSAYALGRMPDDEETGTARSGPLTSSFTRTTLYRRGADYFRQTRQPRENWKTLADLVPQLAEFHLRCAAGDYDTAAEVLLEIDADHLYLWGHSRLMAELHEQLQNKLNDLDLKEQSVSNLGTAYRRIGQVQKSINCYKLALSIAHEQKDRWGEGGLLGNLGNCYVNLGQTTRAIDYYEQSLVISREIGEHEGEAIVLSNLGTCYANLGQTARAIDYYEQSLVISREIGDRLRESVHLENTGHVQVDLGEYREATQNYNQAIQIANEISFVQTQNYAHWGLALAHLYVGDLPAARTAIEAARQYDEPQNNHNVLALLGLIALRQGDQAAAQEAFTAAVAQAEQLLTHTPQYYEALDAKGLALCGLVVIKSQGVGLQVTGSNVERENAVAAYRAARAINRDAGIVGRVVRLLEALAVVDSAGVVASMRAVAAGEEA
jgi:tetratricopeptide (TPR) repeat protein